MAAELTVVLRFEENQELPSSADIESQFDCIVMEYELEEEV